MRYHGRITNWQDDKGFGFIHPSAGGEPLLVQRKSLRNRRRTPTGGDMVTYDRTDLLVRGRPVVRNVVYAGDPAPPPSWRSRPFSASKPRRAAARSLRTAWALAAAVTLAACAGLLVT